MVKNLVILHAFWTYFRKRKERRRRSTHILYIHMHINKLIKDIELPREWQKDLKQYCDSVGIEFMSTPFDELAVKQLQSSEILCIRRLSWDDTDLYFGLVEVSWSIACRQHSATPEE